MTPKLFWILFAVLALAARLAIQSSSMTFAVVALPAWLAVRSQKFCGSHLVRMAGCLVDIPSSSIACRDKCHPLLTWRITCHPFLTSRITWQFLFQASAFCVPTYIQFTYLTSDVDCRVTRAKSCTPELREIAHARSHDRQASWVASRRNSPLPPFCPDRSLTPRMTGSLVDARTASPEQHRLQRHTPPNVHVVHHLDGACGDATCDCGTVFP